MSVYRNLGSGLEVRSRHDVLRVEAWGHDSVRVRAAIADVSDERPGALDERPNLAGVEVRVNGVQASLTNGRMTARLWVDEGEGDTNAFPMLRFEDTATGRELIAEQRAHFWWPGPRGFESLGGGRYRIEQHFRAYPDERLYGLGQRPNGHLDQKGMALDLVNRNSEVSIPFMLSNRGYGFLWNNPAVGHVELATNRTRWVADASRQIDYWVSTGSPADILGNYAEVTGHPPMLPEWASGFWQSKLRYRTQDELLEVAREYRRRGLPLSVIVVDFFHWTALGDWKFDPVEWPDPSGMIEELHGMGVKLMVSIWPLVSPYSENYGEMARRGLLVGAEQGPALPAIFPEKGMSANVSAALYDATNPDARSFIWAKARENYLDHGVDLWWLDACEPELRPLDPGNLRFHAGPGDEVLGLYPLANAQAFYEGMREAGRDEVISLVRSGWAGSQRYGAAIWSGDIPATFEALRAQVRAGLNVAISGIPWWTTDIGGFHGGAPADPAFRELIVRWFEYGAFCPLFRLHGDRLPRLPLTTAMTGGPNEVWSFGDEAFDMIRDVLELRERLRPYLMEQMRVAHERGLPPMRPLFVDFPDDPGSWLVEDQFMVGPDLVVAPILEAGSRGRDVYVPPGQWLNPWTGMECDGAVTVHVDAPLERIPVLARRGSAVSAVL